MPQGIKTHGQSLFTVIDDHIEQIIGMVWIGEKELAGKNAAFIYDLVIYEDFRGKGYGKQLMSLIEEEVKKLGMISIGLHVFGHNHIAIELYQKAGYKMTNLMMRKDLKHSSIV